MKRLSSSLLLLLLCISAYGQARPSAGRFMGGAGPPTFNCNPGPFRADAYVRTDVNPHTLYICSAAPNGWTLISGGGGGGGLSDPGANGLIKRTSLNNTAVATPGVDYLTPTGSGSGLTGLMSDPGSNGIMKRTGFMTTAIAIANTDYQAADGDLITFSNLTPTNNDLLQFKSGAWANRTIAQLKADLAYNFSEFGGSVTNAQLAGSIATSKLATLSGNSGKVATAGTIASGKCVEADANGNLVTAANNAPCSTGGSITGADTQVTFFDGANAPAGDAGFTYNKTTDVATVGGLNVNGSGLASDKMYDAAQTHYAGWIARSAFTADYQFEFPDSGFAAGLLRAGAIGSSKSVITVVSAVDAPIWLPAAGCVNTTAASFWDLPTSTPMVAACVTGSNTQKGVLQAADTSGGFSAQNSVLLRTDFTGTVDARIIWKTTATSGNAKFSLSTICTATDATETDDPAFNTASTVTTAAPGTANRLQTSTITSLTISGCSAGKFLHVKLFRDGNDGSDTLGASLDVIGVLLTPRYAP